jgi:acetoacetyl-CoA synthetase
MLGMPVPADFSLFVKVRSGVERPPIFIAPGLSGMVLRELAAQIRCRQPIYGIQAKGSDGMQEPFDRVEDMASFYLEALKKCYPDGPYILIGYSFGGLVALEMAQRLVENGEVVALVLLDAFPHPRFLSAPQRIRLFIKRMGRHCKAIRRMPFAKALDYFAGGLRRRLKIASLFDRGETLGRRASPEAARTRLKAKAYSAYSNYRPKFYPGKLKFVAASINPFFPDDPVAVWGGLAKELDLEVIPGDHLNIMTSHCAALASVLSRYVEEITAQDKCLQP